MRVACVARPSQCRDRENLTFVLGGSRRKHLRDPPRRLSPIFSHDAVIVEHVPPSRGAGLPAGPEERVRIAGAVASRVVE